MNRTEKKLGKRLVKLVPPSATIEQVADNGWKIHLGNADTIRFRSGTIGVFLFENVKPAMVTFQGALITASRLDEEDYRVMSATEDASDTSYIEIDRGGSEFAIFVWARVPAKQLNEETFDKAMADLANRAELVERVINASG